MSSQVPDVDGRRLRVLAVCIGNVCRSPFLERLLAASAEARGIPLSVTSAGVGAVEGAAIHPGSSEARAESTSPRYAMRWAAAWHIRVLS